MYYKVNPGPSPVYRPHVQKQEVDIEYLKVKISHITSSSVLLKTEIVWLVSLQARWSSKSEAIFKNENSTSVCWRCVW
jgi:hypothetical protein